MTRKTVTIAGTLYTVGALWRATTNDKTDTVSTAVRQAIITAVRLTLPKPLLIRSFGTKTVVGSVGGETAFGEFPKRFSQADKIAAANVTAVIPCGQHDAGYDVGHRIHRCYGGNLQTENLALECTTCNRHKSAHVNSALYGILTSIPLTVILPETIADELTH